MPDEVFFTTSAILWKDLTPEKKEKLFSYSSLPHRFLDEEHVPPPTINGSKLGLNIQKVIKVY